MSYPKQSQTVHVEMLNDELCLYDWQRKEVHALNPTAAQVWQLCDGQTSPQQMAEQLNGDLNAEQAEALVWASLEQLREAHLLEGEIAKPASFPTLTRRQMLKLLGGAAAGVALLPVINSIVAPTPVAAQSPVPTEEPTAEPTEEPTAEPTPEPPPAQTCQNYDIVIVADMSGSVDNTELQSTKDGIIQFINAISLPSGTTQIGLASYGDAAVLDHELTQDSASLIAAVNGLIQAGSTNIAAGIDAGGAELQSPRHIATNPQLLVVMTDGNQNMPGDPIASATTVKAAGIRIVAVALTVDADATTMQAVASAPSDYYYSDTFVDLGNILETIDCTAS